MNLKHITQILNNYKEVFLTLLALAAIVLFVRHKLSDTQHKGIITIAKIVKWKAAESGSDLYIDIFLNDKIYHTTLGYGCRSSSCIGKFFFVRVLKDDPTDYPILYDDKPVPNCILSAKSKFEGWDKFPDCDNF